MFVFLLTHWCTLKIFERCVKSFYRSLVLCNSVIVPIFQFLSQFTTFSNHSAPRNSICIIVSILLTKTFILYAQYIKNNTHNAQPVGIFKLFYWRWILFNLYSIFFFLFFSRAIFSLKLLFALISLFLHMLFYQMTKLEFVFSIWHVELFYFSENLNSLFFACL